MFCDNVIMSDWLELMNVIDSCSSLFLRDIGEPEENVLRLVLHEGKISVKASRWRLPVRKSTACTAFIRVPIVG